MTRELEAGQRLAEAEVRAEPERDVLVRVARSTSKRNGSANFVSSRFADS